MSRLQRFLVAGVIALIPSLAFAQRSGSTSSPSAQPPAAAVETILATPTGHDVHFDVGGYKYVEPGDTSISIHGIKVGGGYTGTMSLSAGQHWFLQTNARGLLGNTTYDGWCSPFLITPDSRSPNGYALDIGDPSPCSESGDKDWYVEGRALVGKDFIGRTWGWAPMTGLGIRHLSNGTTGVAGYRTDDYLYLPIGMTARTTVASRNALSFNVEYDHLLHGWQKTIDSALGGGEIPATPTAPAFTIDSFTDLSFDQHHGFAVRASAKYAFNRRWSLEPYWIYWSVGDSTLSDADVRFTVRGISAVEQFQALEPQNTTNEFGVKFSVHIR